MAKKTIADWLDIFQKLADEHGRDTAFDLSGTDYSDDLVLDVDGVSMHDNGMLQFNVDVYPNESFCERCGTTIDPTEAIEGEYCSGQCAEDDGVLDRVTGRDVVNPEERIAELEGILKAAQDKLIAEQDPNDEPAMATCGECGLSWDDAAVSGVTPTPSGRCPFEYYHEEARELHRLLGLD